MITPAEAIEAQRKVIKHISMAYLNEPFEIYNIISPEELARLYAIKDAFEKVMALLNEVDSNEYSKR